MNATGPLVVVKASRFREYLQDNLARLCLAVRLGAYAPARDFAAFSAWVREGSPGAFVFAWAHGALPDEDAAARLRQSVLLKPTAFKGERGARAVASLARLLHLHRAEAETAGTSTAREMGGGRLQ